jgi:hypothetical protein
MLRSVSSPVVSVLLDEARWLPSLGIQEDVDGIELITWRDAA